MSIKLRELIRNVRACKTAAEERGVIAKESALIRTAFRSKGDASFRHRNVAKLLYIHMLGFPTHFGQMESLKLIASPNFPEKRIGYLGLMILLDEKAKVLMLVTNSIKNDFTNSNPYIVGLALCALGNICTADMARDLSNEVEKFFRNSNPYIRKKAALCAVRLVRKAPELVEEYIPGANGLLNDSNHAVQLSGIQLVIDMIKIDPSCVGSFRKTVPTLVRLLKNLLLGGYVNEYDVVGITDPFLQTKIIHLLRLLGTGNAECSELMNDILAQVAINTEPTKNPGNAILYECVQTIMSIEAENGLRVLAVNILGRFLQNRDNNIRYVALNTLCKVVSKDTEAIQRHRNTVVECLKDADISIRRRALDLIYALVTKSNVRALVKELLNYLALTSGDVEFKSDLTDKICLVADRYAPSKRWHIDTIISVLSIAGNYTKENVSTDLIVLISRAKALNAYAVHKLFSVVRGDNANISQLPLVHVALWAIGEYGDLLLSPQGVAEACVDKTTTFEPASESKVLDVIARVMRSTESKLLTKEYALNALVKLTAKFTSEDVRLRKLIGTYQTSMSLELQQRSVEYSQLFSAELQKIRSGVVARMPVPAKRSKDKGDEKKGGIASPRSPSSGDDEELPDLDVVAGETEESDDDEPAETSGTTKVATKPSAGAQATPTPVIATPAAAASTVAAPVQKNVIDIFGGVFGDIPAVTTPLPGIGATSTGVTTVSSTPTPVAVAAPAKSGFDIIDIFGSIPATSATPVVTSTPAVGVIPGFGGMFAPVPQPVAVTATPTPGLGGMFPGFGGQPVAPISSPIATPSAANGGMAPTMVYQNNNLSIMFAYNVNPATPNIVTVTATFTNHGAIPMAGFDFKVAVPKFINLTMAPPSSSVVPPNGAAPPTQVLTLDNTQYGKKKTMIKVRIEYNLNGTPVTEDAQINQFP